MPIIYRNIAKLIEYGLSASEYLNMPVTDIYNLIKTINKIGKETEDQLKTRQDDAPVKMPKTLDKEFRNIEIPR